MPRRSRRWLHGIPLKGSLSEGRSLCSSRKYCGRTGDRAGPAKIQVLNQAYAANNDFVNNSSVAYLVSLNGTNVVFLGDMARSGGENLMANVDLGALNCTMVQMAHHGQNGVDYEVYKALRPSVCLWPTPQWLWDNDNGGGTGTGPWKTQETRNWMVRLGVKTISVQRTEIR